MIMNISIICNSRKKCAKKIIFLGLCIFLLPLIGHMYIKSKLDKMHKNNKYTKIINGMDDFKDIYIYTYYARVSIISTHALCGVIYSWPSFLDDMQYGNKVLFIIAF